MLLMAVHLNWILSPPQTLAAFQPPQKAEDQNAQMTAGFAQS
jgi:hypothetical protein